MALSWNTQDNTRPRTDSGAEFSHVSPNHSLTLLEPQSRFGGKLLGIRAVCPQNGTAVLNGLRGAHITKMEVLESS